MSSLIGIHSLSKSYGTQILFKEISFTIHAGDRIGLLGPNGAGKSSLIKILAGLDKPDSGSVSRKQNLQVGYASQDPEFPNLSLEEVLLHEKPTSHYVDEQELLTRARILLSKAQFTDYTQNASTLSGGWKKRLDIVRALMKQPDILLLDEPTNHLDLEGILWLEKFLNKEKISFVVVSHDRYFLENVSNKIMELNRCYPQGLFSSDGNMSAFMEHREAFLKGQQQLERGLASVVRDEIEWLRKSPKARTTKSRSRIGKAYELMEELSEVKQRNVTKKVEIDFSASERATQKLLVAKNISKKLGDKQLFTGIDITLSPRSRLGIVGKNGTGKTTLLKILGGLIPPDSGTLKFADDLKLVYFDQHREHIPADISLRKALSPTNDRVNYRGQDIHVNGWAKKFLFSPERMELPVGCLSGGERARILIAKLMLQPADILFLDEPTNDLDIATLEVIEESLMEFAGAVVMISHDRCLMERVCTQILGLGENCEQQFFADYGQWEAAQQKVVKKELPVAKTEIKPAVVSKPKKLSYHEQKELENMEKNILHAEQELEQLQTKINSENDPKVLLELYHDAANAQRKLDTLFERWQYLSSF